MTKRISLRELALFVSIAVVAIIVMAPPTLAEPLLAPTSTPPSAEWNQELMPSFLKIILALLVVAAAIYGSLWLLKKGMGKRMSSGRSGDIIETIETAHLAPKKAVTLIRVGKKSALVAVTESGVSLLMELSEEDTIEALALAQGRDTGPGFGVSLNQAWQKMTALRGGAKKEQNDDPKMVSHCA